MRRERLGVLILTLGALTATPAGAQDVIGAGTQAVSFGVVGGASVPVSDLADGAKVGWHAGVGIGFSLPGVPLGLRIDGLYHGLGEESGTFFAENGTFFSGEAKTRIIGGTLNAVWQFPTASPIRPYLIGGIGVYDTQIELTAIGTGFGFSASENKTSVGFNGGGGLFFRLSGFETFVEARYHHILSALFDEEGEMKDPGAFVPISFGIMFR